MINPLVAIFGLLSLFAVLPELLTTEAYAKGRNYNPDYTFVQSLWLIIMPAIITGAILFMIALYARENQELTSK